MEIVDPSTIDNIEDARERYAIMQKRLHKVEECLDDLRRATEIAMLSHQYHLLLGFLQDAQVCLEDRLVYPEISEEELNKSFTIIEDDRKELPTKSS